MTSKEGRQSNFSATEAAVYDRQIRLWGVEAQNMLRHSSVLVNGMTGLGAEVAKNLILCGLNSMTITDNAVAQEDDLLSNFFLTQQSIGKNRALESLKNAAALNPLVKFEAKEMANCDIIQKQFLSAFSLVIFCDQPYEDVRFADELCRELNIRFIASSVFGWLGYCFFDFNNHKFILKKKIPCDLVELDSKEVHMKNDEFETIVDEDDLFEKRTVSYPSFESTFNVDWTSKKLIRKAGHLLPSTYYPLRALLRIEQNSGKTGNGDLSSKVWREEVESCGRSIEDQTFNEDHFEYLTSPQLSATAAVIGGFVGQEAIKALTEAKYPIMNMIIYSAIDSNSRVCAFPPH